MKVQAFKDELDKIIDDVDLKEDEEMDPETREEIEKKRRE